MLAAARVDDAIGHSHALAGLIGGTLLGAVIAGAGAVLAGMLFVAGVAATCIGVGVLLIGASVAVGMLSGMLATKARDACVEAGAGSLSPSGVIDSGSPNVFTNGLPAAAATLSIVTCTKDQTQQVAQGSSTVQINGFPASRVNDKTTCDATLMAGSPNVFIGGGTDTTLLITPEVADWMYLISDSTLFAASLLSFGGGMSAGTGALAKLFSKIPFASTLAKVACVGGKLMIVAGAVGILTHPVDVTTGQKFLHDDDELDFETGGELPVFWQRCYLSSHLREGVLGQGWSLYWESVLTRVGDGILWRNTLGDAVPFPDIPPGHQVFCPEQACWLTHDAEGQWSVRDTGPLVFHYAAFDEHGLACLNHITDNVGHRQTFHYNRHRQMIAISNEHGLDLRCEYHPDHPRLHAVWQQTPDGEVCRVRYDYDQQARLIAVSLRGENVVRRFGWHDGHGRMAWHETAAGLRCEYVWTWGDDLWRVTEQKTSEGAGYRLLYNDDERHRTAVYYDASEEHWQLDADLRVTAFTDRTGHTHRLQWDEQGQLAGYRSPLGHQRTCEWDALSRLISLTDASGARTRWQYEKTSDRPTFTFWPDGAYDHQAWDERGRLVHDTDVMGQTTSYHYPSGRTQLPDRITDARGGESQVAWDRQGNLVRYTDCSGHATRWEYDALGQLLMRRDALHHKTHYHWNAAGHLERRTLPDGSQEYFNWSPAGLLTGYRQGEHPPRQWHYNALGQPLSATDRLQRTLRYRYDAEGRLLSLDNDNGGAYRFTRDAQGRLLEERRPDNTLYAFSYDADGQTVTVSQRGTPDDGGQRPENVTHLLYNETGKLTARHTLTAHTTYRWDIMGSLLEARRTPTAAGVASGIKPNTVTLKRDALGRIIHEHNGVEELTRRYDALGNLTTLGLPRDNQFQWLHYGSGHVAALRYNDQIVSEFSRDALHRETSRTQGALTQKRQYTALGQRRWQSSAPHRLAERLMSPEQGLLWRAYRYDDMHELAAVEDSQRGAVSYGYDEEGRLLSTCSPAQGQTALRYDRADNILPDDGPAPQALSDNRVTTFGRWRYQYDARGNLRQRREGYRIQTYRYDADNRLIGAKGDGPEGTFEARYHYDALGRRLSKVVKIRGDVRETRFLWQGLRLIQSTTAQGEQTYCYDPDEPHTPLACIEKRHGDAQLYWYHTDLNGSPQEVTDEKGEMVWSGQYAAWGQVVCQTDAMWRNMAKPLGTFRQPLRYAGQYVDEETGLHYNTFRYYAPETGRFTTPDPIGLAGGLNLYAYAPNPIYWIDPLGLTSCFYRGSRLGEKPSFVPKPNEYKIDPVTANVKTTHGVSVFDNPTSVSSKGFEPYKIDMSTVSDKINIIQRGNDLKHFEIVPSQQMPLADYIAELAKIKVH